ncbi:hypothetical protein PSTG_11284 [Puccinia striiformis f. sp. tritici PST-78]|uniref:No apical meristem-associated C-terminal domain-containing protein n=1 Tax=Puccinia striiformis f. sp. tritici PST-78 TaxID=1165861 RepID=A0A0L0V899_9BASI|nr:hypothetical protein PSTG_11284 [Puccinia striiformis f. sp. tritici PST-78]
MVTAEKGTWNKLIEAHPKQKFRSLRTMTIHWFDLAAELFDTSMANGEGAVLPGEAPPKDGGDKCSPDLTNSSDLSKISVKRRRGLTKAIDLDLSDDDKITFKQSAREPPKKRIRESKFDILKSGVEAIVEVLQGGQENTKPNQTRCRSASTCSSTIHQTAGHSAHGLHVPWQGYNRDLHQVHQGRRVGSECRGIPLSCIIHQPNCVRGLVK